MMVATQLYRALVMLLVSRLCVYEAAGNNLDCTYVAVLGTDKRVPCPQAPPTCSNSSEAILWCLADKPSVALGDVAWEICISTEGVELVIGSPPISEGVSVDGEGRLVISGDVLGTQLQGGSVNCSWWDLVSNDTCSEGKTESFVVLDPYEHPPSIIPSTFKKTSYSITAGLPLSFCVLGRTNGIPQDSAHWISHAPVALNNITGQTSCQRCNCKDQQDLLDSFVSSTESVQSFLNLYRSDDCLTVPDMFELYFYIPRAGSDTSGNFVFEFWDRKGLHSNEIAFDVSIDYLSIAPVFHSPLFNSMTISVMDDVMLLCNVTATVGTTLMWAGPNITTLNSTHCQYTNEYNYTECICDGVGGVWSIPVEQLPVYHVGGAELVQTARALVICHAMPTLGVWPYICHASNVNRFVLVTVTSETPSTATPTSRSSFSIDSSSVTMVTSSSVIMVTTLTPPPHNPVSFQLVIIIFAIVLLLLTVGIVVMVTMVICCRCNKTHVVGAQRNLYNWLPLVDRREFTREHLILLENRGEGQFGEVWRALAPGIVPGNQARNIVAVKKLKDTATELDANVLLQELDIMKKIRPHPNIVNLLGYCTVPVHKPLYIIMEYAELGSLKSWLVSFRHVMQSKLSDSSPDSAHDHTLLQLPHPHHFPPVSPVVCDVNDNVVCKCTDCHTQRHSYINLNEGAGIGSWREGVKNDYYNEMSTSYDKKSSNCGSMIDIGMEDGRIRGEEERGDSAPNSCIHGDVFTSQSDYSAPSLLSNKFILDCTIQIARGMEHLQNMKCLHRDLAARNVLIAEGFQLKVSDFGLARELNDNDYYRKQTSGRVPARWMAIESLDSQRVHTHWSDVWSYGVLLWEIHTYGKCPYGKEGVALTCHSLLCHLKDGNRLPRPLHCSEEMHKLMRQCWDATPTSRPSFSNIVKKLDRLLSIEHGYLALSEPLDTKPTEQTSFQCPSNKSRSHSPFPPIDDNTDTPPRSRPDNTKLRSHSPSPYTGCTPDRPSSTLAPPISPLPLSLIIPPSLQGVSHSTTPQTLSLAHRPSIDVQQVPITRHIDTSTAVTECVIDSSSVSSPSIAPLQVPITRHMNSTISVTASPANYRPLQPPITRDTQFVTECVIDCNHSDGMIVSNSSTSEDKQFVCSKKPLTRT